MKITLILSLFMFFVVGCSMTPKTSYNASTEKTYTAKAPTCKFGVRGTIPRDAKIEEVGTISITPSMFSNGVPILPKNVTELRELISKDVCKNGGDFVVTEVNGVGYYVRAIIFKKL